jgi:hypothetical protein
MVPAMLVYGLLPLFLTVDRRPALGAPFAGANSA